jgi:hypothetical protein
LEYEKNEQSHYERKNQAIQLLAQSPFAKLSVYRPEEPDKIQVQFCPSHFEMFREV